MIFEDLLVFNKIVSDFLKKNSPYERSILYEKNSRVNLKYEIYLMLLYFVNITSLF